MAYILKSDRKVLGDNNFQYITDNGLTYKDVAVYIAKLKENGYTLSSEEFNALHKYVEALKELGVWDSFFEFMPMFGNNLDAQLTKLKFVNSQMATEVQNMDRVTINGTKGMEWTTHERYTSPAVDLGIDNNYLMDNGGQGILFNGYIDRGSQTNTNVYGNSSVSFGRVLDKYTFKFFGSSPGLPSLLNNPSTLYVQQKLSSDRQSVSDRILYSNDNEIFESSALQSITPDTENYHIYLGALHNSTNPTEYGFFGKMRLFALHNTDITKGMIPSVISLTNTFIEESGKSI